MASLGGMTQAPNAAKDADVKREISLENHPELNEQGIPYRNASKRSSVAEAHRRALERREKERVAKEEREQFRAKEPAATSVEPPPPTLSPEGRAPRAPLSHPPLRPLGIKPEGEKLALPPRTELSLPATAPRAPMMPKPTPPAQVEPEAPVSAAQDEAVDRVIPNVAGPVVVEPPREPQAAVSAAPSEQGGAPLDEQRTAPVADAAAVRAESPVVSPRGAASAPTAGNETPPRYWHEVPSTGQYTRMELPPVQGGEQRQPDPIGRQRPEPPVEPRPTSGRRIRTIEEVKNGLPATLPSEPPVAQPPRITPPRPAATSQPGPAVPPVPEVAPRQIDEALLRQLEANWRTQELAAHTGQRCGNCRFFRPTEGGEGNCGCSFSNVYGRPIEPQGLSCLDGLGTWWAAADDGWLERTERRPRRATPLLDALLREREEELARSMPERRRAR